MAAFLKKQYAADGLLRGQPRVGSLQTFFFLRRRRCLFNWPRAADLRVDLNELLTELLVVSKLRDLPFRFGECGLAREGFADGPAFDLVSQPIGGSMPRLVGTVATAIRLATTARSGGDGTGTKIAQTCQLARDIGTLLLEILKGMRQGYLLDPSVSHTQGH